MTDKQTTETQRIGMYGLRSRSISPILGPVAALSGLPSQFAIFG